MAFQVIGHRGAAGHAPENTAPSFALALSLGVDAVELDIQLTRDGELVVFHDLTLERTTNGRGPVAQISAVEVKRLDAGGWFHPDYAGTPVLFWRELLELLPATLPLVVELKEPDRHTEAVAAAVQALSSTSRRPVLFSSFYTEALAAALQEAPAIPRAWLMSPAKQPVETVLAVAEQLQLREVCPSTREVTAGWVEAMHAADLGVRAWGLPNQETHPMVLAMRHLLACDVDGATADFPDVLRTAVQAWEAANLR